jgi:hypothetical protein
MIVRALRRAGSVARARRLALGLAGALACVCSMWVGVGSAGAVVGASVPAWQATVVAFPSVQPEGVGRKGRYDVVVENIGADASNGEVTVKDDLPMGLSATKVAKAEPRGFRCPVETGPEVVCVFSGETVPSGFMVVTIEYEVKSVIASPLRDVAAVSGGGAQRLASGEAVTSVGGEHAVAPPGVAKFAFRATGPAGEPFEQAGGHSHFVTTTLLLHNERNEQAGEDSEFKPVAPVRNLEFYLPLGFLGNVTVAAECHPTLVEINGQDLSGCPQSSRVGTVLAMIADDVYANSFDSTHEHGIYNIVPEKGYPAELAFASNNLTFVMYATAVRRDGKYMTRIAIPNLSVAASLVGAITTFYGDDEEHFVREGGEEATLDRGAFLTDPSDCDASPEALSARVEFNTWTEPGVPPGAASAPAFTKLEGCNLLRFSSTMSVKPQTTQAGAPSGYQIGLNVPQAPNGGTGLGTPPVKDVNVTLPEGTTISPSAANGLEACQDSGPEGINIEGEGSEEVAADGLERPAPGKCPEASAIATVKATSPLLHEQLEGHLFVAQPQCGGPGQAPCTNTDAENGKLFGIYLEVQAPEADVIVKLAGHASVDPATGRITTVFDENPQFPLSNITASTTRGARAPLANPVECGPAVSESALSSWASPYTNESFASDYFNVDWDGAGGSCPGSVPFAPSAEARTTVTNAGATTPFVFTLKREDREQNILAVATTLPKGLLGYVSKVARCPEPAASEEREACPAESQIGTATVAVGSGSDPYNVTGKVYFTGPYNGAPFGLSILVPAVAGPFNLGYVLVRVALTINPTTAQVTATSSDVPQMLDGVPARVRSIQLAFDTREFVVNPTNCEAQSITGTVKSATDGEAGITAPLTTYGCSDLPFAPTLSVSTEASATKVDGTGVDVKVAYPGGIEANVAKLKIAFPTQLPVRLETLRKACLAAVFQANPANCPAAADIGTATVHTPILANPLSGPLYLVSFGNAKFPNVVMVLQGEGVTLEVEGESSVSAKTSVLTATFNSVPDAPFSTFEARLPRGPFSEFTSARTIGRASASQCGQELVAPVAMLGQNGAEHKEAVKVQITGCRPSIAVSGVRAGKTALALTVDTTVGGRLKIAGGGLKTLVKSNLSAGVHKLKVQYTKTGRVAARTHRKIRVTLGLVAGKQHVSKEKTVKL